tara:strand:+ start:2940 stop:3869 length:930 start_codon:yes stop_codon:yes gene_type:complete
MTTANERYNRRYANAPKVVRMMRTASRSDMGQFAGRAAGIIGEAAAGYTKSQSQKIFKGITMGPKDTVKLLGKMAGKATGLLGINFSLSSLLKQSQIFTGVLGTIFQILGAMVDAFLAPLMPYFTNVFQRMVTWIPWAQEKGEQFAAWIQKILDTSDGPMAALGNMLKEGFMNTVKWLWSSISESNVISKMVFGNDKSLMANILGTFLKLATAALLGAILGGMIGGPLGAAIGARAGLAIGGYAMASNRFGGGGGGSAPAAATGAGGLPVSVEVIGPDNQQLRVNQYKSADKQRVIISSEGTDFTGEIQ